MEAPPPPGLGLVVAVGPKEAFSGLDNTVSGLARGEPIIDGEGGILLRGEPAKEGSEPLLKAAILPSSGELMPSDSTTGELPITFEVGGIGEGTGVPPRPAEVWVGVGTSAEGVPSGPLMVLQRRRKEKAAKC